MGLETPMSEPDQRGGGQKHFVRMCREARAGGRKTRKGASSKTPGLEQENPPPCCLSNEGGFDGKTWDFTESKENAGAQARKGETPR